jgi:signal-transduction protein with cAMP-binding, CBS, and nucleotidyltransferase domain
MGKDDDVTDNYAEWKPFVSKISIFQHLNDNELLKLCEAFKLVEFNQDEIVVPDGENRRFFLI